MADLPFDLLCEISHRLHDAGDYVSFHAVCRAWRSSLPPSHCRPALLPWLLSTRNATTGHRTAARGIFSPKNWSPAAVLDRRWVIRADGGAAACFLLPSRDRASSRHVVVDPFTASATTPLPPLPGEIDAWVKHAFGTVAAAGGTVVVLAISHNRGVLTPFEEVPNIKVAVVRPGEAAWTLTRICHPRIVSEDKDGFCVAYGDGRVVICAGRHCSWSWRTTPALAGIGNVATLEQTWSLPPRANDEVLKASYVLESGGQLLWVSVRVKDHRAQSVEVYALQVGERDEPRLVRMDGRSFDDRVLFLGRPISFAVDAAELGMSGGCAYLVLHRRWWQHKTHLLKYSFHDGTSEFMAQLPSGWRLVLYQNSANEIHSDQRAGQALTKQ